ncbi:class I SAM-dependent methyltransferase [Salinarimonas rosea]|uniref:class I SAM-dependent methyltransferase n=1 Tax=Salinarimonas rosea TaxID=552063 RepID=UPI00041B4EC0|nr:class I SAM-dependent methyltransferase [Salinarimonas rosea]
MGQDRAAGTRREALADLLAEAHRVLAPGFGFRLWDGSRVPADWPEDALAVTLADEGVVAALVRRPRLDTLIKLHVDGRIDLDNGTFFDLAAARPQGKIGRLARGISKGKALRVAGLFWRVDRGPPSVLDAVRGDEIDRDGRPETNRANVAYHYDVSNEFYRLFLDAEMVYTCGYFVEDHDDIDRAQRDKLDMICRKLRLRPGDRFLDIGCGWGALVCHAARHYGVEAHGVTLAAEQLALAKEKAERLGIADRVTFHFKDYVQMEGTFDKIASIGMFEQVGIANHPTYFATVNRLLRPQGLYLHHTIARRAKKSDKRFARMTSEYRALVRYIFPGGELDHLGMSIANLERAGFEIHDVEGWREHYQKTTYLWWKRLLERRAEAEALVGPQKVRMWLLYLAGCSMAFARGGAYINQTLASKRIRGPSGLPPTRADLYR